MYENNFKEYVLRFFFEGGYSFRRFNCNRELIPDCWRSYREGMLANIELSCRNKTCRLFETDDLRFW